jgi:oligosaccharide repeat unit polymerase
MLSLGRKEVTINILFVVLSYLYMHYVYRARTSREVFKHMVIPPAALVILFALIEVILQKGQTYHREGRLAGFIFSLYWYMASPLAAFAEFMKDYDQTYFVGQSLFFPFYKWLYRLWLVPEPTLGPRMEMIYIPYPANEYSYLRNVYEDFGLLGAAIVPYGLGVLSAGMRTSAKAFLPYLNLYLIVLIIIIFSFYDYLLTSNQFYMQAFFAIVFMRFRLRDLDELSL